MASIIEGYNYDIFISYRQKDNKHDGWVTKFVDNLKGELEATIKEDVSVYFDENPHDRLQETHNVDKSLEGKLKCLIFIPILSKTYCDPNSYAWQYELLTFIRMAEQDRFGKDVSLRSGNVASRILPIRIHDLEPEDIKLFEKETGSVLRAMDFVFKTASGVNRPLKANEDHPQDNLNKTFYSDQINKVANAIDEIIHSLKGKQPIPVNKKLSSDQPHYDTEEDKSKVRPGTTIINKKSKRWLITGLSAVLSIAAVFIVFKIIEGNVRSNDISNLEKSIAVLPFVNDSPDKENEYFCNGMMDEVLNNLQRIKDFRVLSRTSVEQYRGASKQTIPKIAKELDVNYIVEGSVQKYGNVFRLRVQLIAANNEKHLWGESYEKEVKESKDIFNIQSQVAQSIAEELRVTITPEESKIITKSITTNLRAYDLFFQARNENLKFWMDNSCVECLKKSMILYHQALHVDSTFAQAYTGIALGYLNKYYMEGLNVNFMDSVLIYANKAVSYNDKLDEAHFVKGNYYNITGNYNIALKEFNEAIKLNPNYSWAYYGRGDLFFMKIFNQISGFEDLFMAIQLEYGPLRPSMMKSLGLTLGSFGFTELARYYIEESVKLDNDSIDYLNNLAFLEVYENPEKAIELSSKVLKRDSSNLNALWTELILFEILSKYEESNQIAIKIIQINKEKGIQFQSGLDYIGYAFLKTGQIKEAKSYFDKQIAISEKILKLDPLDNNSKLALTRIYAALGKKKDALQILNDIRKEGNERRSKGSGIMPQIYLFQLKYEPMYENLMSEPIFQDYIDEVESSYKTDFEKLNLLMKNKGVLKE